MKIINRNEFLESLNKIELSSFSKNNGDYDLIYKNESNRIIVIYFNENEDPDYIYNIFNIILRLNDLWFVFPRLNFPDFIKNKYNTYNEVFVIDNKKEFSQNISNNIEKLIGVGDDFYLISKDEKTMVTISHHTSDEGLTIELVDKDKCKNLLISLNEINCQIDFISNSN